VALRHVLHFADVLQTDGRAAHAGDDDALEILWLFDSAERAEREFPPALIHPPAGHLYVLRGQRRPHLVDVDVIGVQLFAVQPDLDLAATLADEPNLPDAGDRLDVLFDLVVDDLGRLAQVAAAGDHDVNDRRGVGRELLITGGSASRGNWLKMAETLSRTSCAATSGSFSSRN